MGCIPREANPLLGSQNLTALIQALLVASFPGLPTFSDFPKLILVHSEPSSPLC